MRTRNYRQFGSLQNLPGLFDGPVKKSFPMDQNYPTHERIVRECKPMQFSKTTFPNGVTVITETPLVLGSVHMGVTISAGTRDENVSTSGTLHALQKTYLKTNTRANEHINYQLVQRSGGAYSMIYDQEFTHYFGYCLSQDTYDFLQLTADILLENKTMQEEKAARDRLRDFWGKHKKANDPKARLDELWLSIAYGLKDYGMPTAGLESNRKDITFYAMNYFRKIHMSPDRMIVWGSGVVEHDQFVKAVSPYFGSLEAVQAKERKPPKYLGGELFETTDSPVTHVSLSFQGLKRGQEEAANVLKCAFGHTGGPVQSRAMKRFQAKFPQLMYLEPHHTCFAEAGNFRFNLAAPNDTIGEICSELVEQLRELADSLTEEEVNRGKLIYSRESFDRLISTPERMIEATKKFASTGKIETMDDLSSKIAGTTVQDVKEAARRILKSPVTLVAIGGNTNAIPSAVAIQERLR